MIRIIIEIDNDSNLTIKKEPQPFENCSTPLKPSIEKPPLFFLDKKSNDPLPFEKKKHGGSITVKKRVCPKCGEEFIPSGNRQKYCSEKCGMKPKLYIPKKLRSEVINKTNKAVDKFNYKQCLECKEWFDPNKTIARLTDFCSIHCRTLHVQRESFKDKH